MRRVGMVAVLAFQIISIIGYEPGTTDRIFSATTTFGGRANTTCTGTANEFGETFDFLIVGFIAGR